MIIRITGLCLAASIVGWLAFSQLTQAQVNNNPTIDSITIAETTGGSAITAINLNEATVKNIYIHGTATDLDGCDQIDSASSPSSWKVVLYRSDLAGGNSCTADDQNCYQDSEQDSDLFNCNPPSDTVLDYEMVIPVEFYADATDPGSSPDHATTNWTAYVEVTDDESGTGSTSTTVEMNTLLALTVSESINYGELDLGDESAEKPLTITNTGNHNDLDPTIADYSGWNCDIGSFDASQVHWNTTPALGYAGGNAVSDTDTDLYDLSITKSTDGSPSTDDVYLTLKLPTTGISGNCSNSLTIVAN